MKCAVHSEVDAVGYCRNCGKALCSACVRPVRDVLYCEDCLATLVEFPRRSPGTLRICRLLAHPGHHLLLQVGGVREVPPWLLSWHFSSLAWGPYITANITKP